MSDYTKLELEFAINASPKVLFYRLSTPGGLSEWFADDVNLTGTTFSFIWDGNEQKAELLSKKEGKYIRFRWLEDDDDAYFEFKISQDDLTGDVALIITECIDPDEAGDQTELWQKQVEVLKRNLGS
ncbi:MAG: START-like domain-containing protein [Bacteroidota bacterium]|nr:START-like domain-containing protein [Bacteroidota bacterium]